MSANHLLISIVVPTYNRAHIILDSLNSVHQQTYRPLELIVVDDGSVDDTASVVQAWASTLDSKDFFSTLCLPAQSGRKSCA